MKRIVAALALVAVSSASAQDFRLNDVLDSLQRGAVRSNLAASEDSVAAFKLDSVAKRLRSARAGEVKVATLARLVAGEKVSFAATNRFGTRGTDLLAQPWFRDDIQLLLTIAFSVRVQLRADTVPADTVAGILAPVTALRQLVRDNAMQQGVERLRRMEIKYGPDAPPLNFLEGGVNYVFQFLPVFRADAKGSPSRFEFIGAYRTMEISAFKSSRSLPDAQLVSAGQVGLRWYHWDPKWGTGFLRPQHASAGLYVVGPKDAPLASLTGVRRRHGAFIGWGGVHVAFIAESPRRVIVGGDRHLIPHIF